MSRLGVGVIGLGVGEQHARAFASHPHCKLVAICDSDPTKLAAVGSKLPVCRHYTAAAELIDDPQVAVVAVASNDDNHYSQLVQALRSGKHVFCEKPLCLRRDELDAIREAWRQNQGVRLSTNTVLRHSPRFLWLRDSIARGEFGTVYCLEADYVYGRLHKLTDGWRGKIPGYSVMLGGGVHMVDLVLWLVRQRPVEVMAYGSNLGSRGTTFSGNDLALALLRFDSGLVAKVSANFASVHPHFHRVVVYGTTGTFENAPETLGGPGRLWVTRDPMQPPKPVDAPYPGVNKGDLIPSFVDAVRGVGTAIVSEEEAFATVSVCLAIDESIRQGSPVAVPYE